MFVSAGINLKFHNYDRSNIEDNELVYKQLGSSPITAVSWCKDNVFLTFVSEKGNPEILSLKDPYNIKSVHTITAITNTSTIAFQNTTKRCIGLGTATGQVVLYDTKTKSIGKLFESTSSSVSLLEFSANDKYMAVCCLNGNLFLYDVKNGDIKQTYTASNIYSPTAMRYHPGEKHILAVALADGSVMHWDTIMGSTRFCAQIHTAPISDLALTETKLMISVGYDNKFCIHDQNLECIFRSNQPHPLTAVGVDHDGITIAVGSENGTISIYDIRRLVQPKTILRAHNTKINKISFENKIKRDIETPETPPPCEKKFERFCDENDIQIPREGDCCVRQSSENKSSEMKSQNESVAMKMVKQEVAESIRRGANELRNHLVSHFESLHNLILNEFNTIDNQIEDKWDLMNIAKDTTNKGSED